MIDESKQAAALIQQLQAHLPISIGATEQLSRLMRSSGIKPPTHGGMRIGSLKYGGETGGIMCKLDIPGNTVNHLMVPLTQVIVPKSHPMAATVHAYQSARAKKIANGERD